MYTDTYIIIIIIIHFCVLRCWYIIIMLLLLCISRLVKGDGEIVEEIVSRERHAAINKVNFRIDC